TLKDVFLTIRDYKNELKRKLVLIISVVILFSLIGYIYSINQEDKYVATLSFIVEGDEDGLNLSSLGGMASQFGLDFGGGGSSSFSQQNVIELLKSRKIVEESLKKEYTISGKRYSLLEHYIINNNIIEDSSEIKFDGIYNDSITNIVWRQIIDNKLEVSYQNDEANILNLNYSSVSSQFAKHFTESLIDEMSRMYSSYQTEKIRFTLNNLKSRSDSVFSELQRSERNLARIKDRNTRVITASGRLDEIRYMREVQVLNTMYLELIKNTEIVKMSLLNETPIIQIVDTPILPLSIVKRSFMFWITIFSFLGLSIISFIVIIRKLVKDTLNEEEVLEKFD
ncbi:MAG: hypothetical protein HOA52_01895, partial [Flavobacteriales bacterium]|nr:hypothetical protein [Flavobacteriales bacterium]